jgi:hypothetical protein
MSRNIRQALCSCALTSALILLGAPALAHNPHGYCLHTDQDVFQLIQGGDGNQYCGGTVDEDHMYGYGEHDRFNGEETGDEMHGNEHDDYLKGAKGDDLLRDHCCQNHYDDDELCDSSGYDTINTEDCCTGIGGTDFIERVDDGTPNEPTYKNPDDEVIHFSPTGECADVYY